MLGEIERRNRSLAAVAAISVVEPRTLTGDEPEQVKCARVTANFFETSGVRALGPSRPRKNDHRTCDRAAQRLLAQHQIRRRPP
jgi:hypothetical protein